MLILVRSSKTEIRNIVLSRVRVRVSHMRAFAHRHLFACARARSSVPGSTAPALPLERVLER